MSEQNRWDYAAIKRLAAELRAAGNPVKIADLIALDSKNDPFYVGRDSEVRDAEWCAEMWHRLGSPGLHLRGFHYVSVSQPEPIPLPRPVKCQDKRTGKPFWAEHYANFGGCWQFMQVASKYARYLGLIPIDDLEDRRNPDPLITAAFDKRRADYGLIVPDLEDPYLYITGMDDYLAQPYYCEIWTEKQSVMDKLSGVCERYSANLIPFIGETTITAVASNLLQRMRRAGNKPTRIFYISDYDKAGQNMPGAMSRKLEWALRTDGLQLDVRVNPLILTREQIESYDLPHAPDSAPDNPVVELDALIALRSGEMERIVGEALQRYFDPEAQAYARQRRAELRAAVMEQVSAITGKYQAEIGALQSMITELRAIDVRASEYTLEPLEKHAAEDEEWLFDSTRDYLTQLKYYKAHKGDEYRAA